MSQPTPNPVLKSMEILIGTWNIQGREDGSEGEINGQITFEWLEGGFFLVQRVDIDYIGQTIKATEIIGYNESKKALVSHYFDNIGNVFEYIWELRECALRIWGGYSGSVASFKGEFSEDRNTVTGRWEWPGGGYEVTMTRAK